MTDVYAFIENNIWIVAIVGVFVLIVADEFIGLSRSVFGDDDDRPPPPPPPDPTKAAWDEPDAEPSREEGETLITDFIEPKSKD